MSDGVRVRRLGVVEVLDAARRSPPAPAGARWARTSRSAAAAESGSVPHPPRPRGRERVAHVVRAADPQVGGLDEGHARRPARRASTPRRPRPRRRPAACRLTRTTGTPRASTVSAHRADPGSSTSMTAVSPAARFAKTRALSAAYAPHRAVPVEVVGRDVEQDRDTRMEVAGQRQLERRDLGDQHRPRPASGDTEIAGRPMFPTASAGIPRRPAGAPSAPSSSSCRWSR